MRLRAKLFAIRHSLFALAAALLALTPAAPARAAQGTQVLSLTDPGAPANQMLGVGGFADLLNKALLSITTMNSGTTAPANSTGAAPVAYQLWCDTSGAPTTQCKIYDGASWLVAFTINTTTHVLQLVSNGFAFTLAGNVSIGGGLAITPQASGVATWHGGTLTNDTNAVVAALLGSSAQENRIVNGDFLVDQRLAGAATTPTAGAYTLDMWRAAITQASKLTLQQSASSPPSSLSKSMLITVASAFTPGASDVFGLQQRIEGSDVADLGFGTASAQTTFVSFWQKCSVTGTYAVAYRNSAATRSYVATYALGVANTWTYETLTIPGDTTGTWLTAPNTIGLTVTFDFGVGSADQAPSANAWQAGNYFSFAGNVQLVANAAATCNVANVRIRSVPVDIHYAPRPFAQELELCRRSFRTSFPYGTAPAQNAGLAGAITTRNPIAAGDPSAYVPFNPPMMSAPTVTTYNPSAANANWRDITAGSDVTVTVDAPATKGPGGVVIGTSGTVATLGDYLGIHYAADAGL